MHHLQLLHCFVHFKMFVEIVVVNQALSPMIVRPHIKMTQRFFWNIMMMHYEYWNLAFLRQCIETSDDGVSCHPKSSAGFFQFNHCCGDCDANVQMMVAAEKTRLCDMCVIWIFGRLILQLLNKICLWYVHFCYGLNGSLLSKYRVLQRAWGWPYWVTLCQFLVRPSRYR